MENKKVSEMTIEEVLGTREYCASISRKLVEVKRWPKKHYVTHQDIERLADIWDYDKMREAYKEVMRGQSTRPLRERNVINRIGHAAFVMTMKKLMRDEEAINQRSGVCDPRG